MKKLFAALCAIVVSATLFADKIYFVNTQGWNPVYAYYWTGNTNNDWPGMAMTKESSMTCSKGDVYSIDVPAKYENIIFNCGPNACQTSDLEIDDANRYWCDEIAYSSLSAACATQQDAGTGTVINYSSAVPSACPDVMLQAFYWDSYDDKGYGNTKWGTLINQVDEISPYFAMVWLPPSARSAGGLGYHPTQYSKQISTMGSDVSLRNLISAFHDNGTRVVADIVINHAGNKSSWCDFYENDFGEYGKFQPDASWICKTDEVNTDSKAGSCKGKATGAADDGYGSEANYGAARDWDHTNTKVQDMFKAYLQWMKNMMYYDGWRYDYCKGFKTTHVNDYNVASSPYISILEYWDGNASTLKSRISQASNNTMAFDFATHYTAFRDGIRLNKYANLKNCGMRGVGMAKYAVTFVDNHDTFNRTDNEDVGNTKNGSSINNASLMLQCNAYIICMPGIPCVFYPHWVKYKDEIKSMIKARYIAGVHSESTVTEESGSGYYKATIKGKTGEILLLLGSNSGYATTPAGYTKAYAGNNTGVYYKGTGVWPRVQEIISGVEEVEVQAPAVLNPNAVMYNILGQQVDTDYKGIVIQNGHKFLLQ